MFLRQNQYSLTDEKKNGGKISEGSNDDNECDVKSQFCQKIYLFHCFRTIFDEEFKNYGLESLRQHFEDLLRKLTVSFLTAKYVQGIKCKKTNLDTKYEVREMKLR